MKSGVTLQQMLTEVKRQSESKEDYLIAPNRLRMESYGKEMFLHLSDDSGTELIEPMTITGIAHRQIGTHLRIPAAYYDRMREERPDLLAYNANTWFKQETSQRMLRTLDGSARAYLSNRYRRIGNIDIAGVTLPILGGLPDIRFESCQITESRMYIKAVNPRLQAEVSPGDIVQAGVIISNSEVGLGSVSIQPLIYRLVCSNGMVVNEAAARRNHVGRVTDSEENFSVYSQATLDAEDKAFVMKIQDTVRAAVEEARFAQVVGKMQEAKAAQMDTHDVPAVVKLASKEFHITDSESTGVLQRPSITNMINHVMEYPEDLKGKKVVVIGGGAVGLDVVEFFAPRGADVSIVEMMPVIGNGIDPVSKVGTFALMDKYGVKQCPNTALLEVKADSFLVKTPEGNEEEMLFDYGFVCLGMRANAPILDAVRKEFEDEDVEIMNIGDSVRARRIIEGTEEGRNILNVLAKHDYL